jgi:hypothetical protein
MRLPNRLLTGVVALAGLVAAPTGGFATLVERTVFAEKFGYGA